MWAWLKSHSKLLLLVLALVLVAVITIAWGFRNRTVRKLRRELALLQTQIKLEKIQRKYDANLEQIAAVREQNSRVEAELAEIETGLSHKLEGDLSADEIADRFRGLGL